MRSLPVALLGGLAALLLASPASAQFADEWAYVIQDDSLISSTTITDANHEADMDWDDLDLDGDTDLVIVRSVPFMFVGKRRNVLLVNEAGVLTNKTATHASTSDVDNGFSTPTQDRDVVIADLDGDSWPDVVTATDLPTPVDTKALAHPRAYMNLGDGGGGPWLGLGHEDARIPQLLHNTLGTAINPRFMGVDAADVDNDGDVDLYFVDQDFTSAFVNEPGNNDTDDRLLLNDGFGFFTDGTLGALTAAIASSDYSNSVAFADFDLDGNVDRVKQNSHQPGPSVYIAYNDDSNPGTFNSNDQVFSGSPYFVNTGELNNDGRPDLIISANNNDRFLLNTGLDGGGEATFVAKTYEFISGSDDSFASNNLVADIDGDGWNEVLHSDVDAEISGYNRRLHIYHNRGGTVGGTDIVLREERESASNGDWIGVPGMTTTDLQGTHDIAVFDVQGDGLNDIVVARLAGTVVWRQYTPWADLDCALAGVSGEPVLTGSGTLQEDSSGAITLTNAAPSALTGVFLSLVETPVPFKGGVLKTVPVIADFILPTNGLGEIALPFVWPTGLGPLTFFAQSATADAAAVKGVSLSNALRADAP
jgi:hypothetical protein